MDDGRNDDRLFELLVSLWALVGSLFLALGGAYLAEGGRVSIELLFGLAWTGFGLLGLLVFVTRPQVPDEMTRATPPTPRNAKPGDQGLILDAALSFAQTQILAQNEDEASLDGQAVGLAAFNGALLAADIAAQEALGNLWWTALLPIAVSIVSCLSAGDLFGILILRARSPRDRTDRVPAFDPRAGSYGDLGPRAALFYERFGDLEAIEAREQLLSDLNLAFVRNANRIFRKSVRIRLAVAILVFGLLIAALLIAFV
jgi:hypothetical protein